MASNAPSLRVFHSLAAPSVGVSFLWTLAGNVVYAAAQWIVVVVLARFGTPAIVGQFALALAITSPILTLANLQLRTVLATDVNERFRYGHCLALRVLTVAGFLLAILAIALVPPFNSTAGVILAAVALMKASESLTDVGYGLLQSRERMDSIAVSQILKATASLGLMFTTLALTRSCTAGVVALAAGFIVTLAAFDVWAVRAETGPGQWRPEWDWARIRELFLLSLPLGSTLLLVSLNANIPRYVLEQFRGLREVGVYSAIAYIAISANLLVMALGQAIAPRMAKAYESNRPYFRVLATRLFVAAAGVGFTGLAAALLAGPAILHIIYGPEYAAEQRVFVWMMIAGILSYCGSAAGFSLTSARFFRVQLPVLTLVCSVTAAACFVLVPAMGAAGAAIAQACGATVQLICSLGYLFFVMRRGVRPAPTLLPALEVFLKREI
jgi:O-antigen/teichoic acid export membrane protein